MVRVIERAGRDKPGLRPQHLQAVRACAQFCSGTLDGDAIGSRELVYHPGKTLSGGAFSFDIGTAGSACMLAFALIPLALFAGAPSQFTIRGGLFQDFAPGAFHMQKILLPLIGPMGANVRIEVLRPGYVPRGDGELFVAVEPAASSLSAFDGTDPGRVRVIRGIALASHLHQERVSERMAAQCAALLGREGFPVEIDVRDDRSAAQKGAALLLWAESDTGCLIGSDMAGKPGRRSEFIAERVVENLFADIISGAAVDRFAADQLVMFAALASGGSRYIVPRPTKHIDSNLWLVRKILGIRAELADRLISVDGIGFFRK